MSFALRCSCALLVLIGCATTAAAQSVPNDQQATLFSRILAYDRNLKARAGSQVTIGVVFKSSNAASRTAGEQMLAAFAPLKQRTIQGLPIDVLSQPYTDAGRLEQWLSDHKVSVIYVEPGLEAEASDIRAAATKQRTAILTSDRRLVQQGFTIAVVNKNGKPGIVINLTSARALGMDFDPKLLQLAEIVH